MKLSCRVPCCCMAVLCGLRAALCVNWLFLSVGLITRLLCRYSVGLSHPASAVFPIKHQCA